MQGHPPAHSEAQQREALARWKGCLDRTEALPDEVPLHQARKLLSNHCEGHRRDVLMAFPASMEEELNEMLKEHSHRQVLQTTAAKWQL